AEAARDRLSWGGHGRLQRTPTAGDEIGDGLFTLFINDPRPAEERLTDITQRVEAIPDYLQSLLARLELPVTRWVKMDQTKTTGCDESRDTLGGWAQQVRLGGSDRRATASQRAKQALTNYSAELGKLTSAPDIHIGDAAMREVIALRGIELSPEELK